MKEYFWDTPPKQGLSGIQQKNHEGNGNGECCYWWVFRFWFWESEEFPKEILPLKPKEVQEIVEQEPASPSTFNTLGVVEDFADISTSPDSKSYEEKWPSSRIKLNHPSEVIVENMNELTLRKHTVDECVANFVSYSCYLSQVEPTKVEEALQDESWVKVMHDELLQFQMNDVWTLVPKPKGEHIIGTKWIFRNKTDEEGNVIHNKAGL